MEFAPDPRADRMHRLHEFERSALPHMDAAYNLAYWLVRNRDDAEDVVQDAYLRAFKAFDALAGEDIRPWLLAIVRNVAYRWLSVRKRTANVIPIEGALAGRDDRGARVLELASEEPSAEDWSAAPSRRWCARRWPSCRRRFARSSSCASSKVWPIGTSHA